MNIKPSDILQRNLTLPCTIIDGDVVVMNVENNEYYAMDAAAARMWAWLEQPTPFSAILNRVENEYHLCSDAYQSQAQEFLTQAVKKNLFHILATSPTLETAENVTTMDTLLEKSTWQLTPMLRTFSINSVTHYNPNVNDGLGS